MSREIVVLSAVRTAIGSFGGSLKDVPMVDLAASVVRASIQRAGLSAEKIGHVVFGNVIPTEARDAYLSRYAAINGGLPHDTPAMNVNRLCGSGLQAVISAAQILSLNEADVAIGGGAETMSRGPYLSQAVRWGARLGDSMLVDYTNGVLHDPFGRFHMGVTAENVAEKYQITRAMQDSLSLLSQQRASKAILEGRFESQIVPIEIPSKKGVISFSADEHVRGSLTLEQLAKLKPAFKADGTVTAGNSSGLNDGASALVLAGGDFARQHRLPVMARLVSYAHSGVDPAYMGIGPVSASLLALKRADIGVGDLDVIESNEAFAAQACAVARQLDLDPAKVNPNGSGISLGHPVGATGAIIATKALHELNRIRGRFALVTMCIGGGQGIAAIFERGQ